MRGVLLLLLAPLAFAASAEERAFRAEVTPFAGARFGGSFDDRETEARLHIEDGDTSFGLLVNWWHSPVTEWEIGVSHQDTSIRGEGLGAPYEIRIDYVQVGGTYLGDGQVARPYLVATVGAAFLDPESAEFESETYFSFSIGGGFKFFPRKRFGLRAEARVFGTVIDDDSRIFCGFGPNNSGCVIATEAEVIWQWELLLGGIVRF